MRGEGGGAFGRREQCKTEVGWEALQNEGIIRRGKVLVFN